MNEKIGILAVKADLNSDNVPYHLGDYFRIGEYPHVEKFAKLIVFDCIESLLEKYGSDAEISQKTISKFLKNRFDI